MQPNDSHSYWDPAQEQAAQVPLQAEPSVVSPSPQTGTQPPVQQLDDAPISWQASEYIHYEKSSLWFLALLGGAVALLLLDLFLIKSWTFGALIVVMAIAAATFARRLPRSLNYTLTSQALHIDEKVFNLHDFRAFGVLQEDAIYSIRLIPNKRFLPAVSVYFPSELGEEIVDVLGGSLAMEPVEQHPIDKLLSKVRF